MDPDENLREQRKLVARLLHASDTESALHPDDVQRLCELVQALDKWLEGGGGLPNEWKRSWPDV